jgi:sugar/nucleoside kinase (ribokinase family)
MATTFSPDLQPQLGKLVVCAGTAVIDNVYRVDRFPVTGIKTRAADFQQILGGCAANAAVAVRRLGGRARLASAIGGPAGRDLTGDSILARLASEEVDTSMVIRVDGANSSLSSILIDRDGERLIVNYRHPSLRHARPSRIDRILAAADVLLIDNRYPDFVLPIAQAARERNLVVVLDGEQTASPNEDLLLAATHIVFSAEGLRAITCLDNLEAALRRVAQRTGAFVAVTDGARDMMWFDGGNLRARPTFRVKAVDTLAAGDVFHGAFALAVAEGQDTEAAMRFAAATSAIKCTRFGGGTGAPTRDEVEKFLAAYTE